MYCARSEDSGEISEVSRVVQEEPLKNWEVTRDPQSNSNFAPENGWLEDDPFLFGMAQPGRC